MGFLLASSTSAPPDGAMQTTVSRRVITAAKTLRDAVDRFNFEFPVAWVYNPLAYGWEAHQDYLKRYASQKKRVVFLGMNPGPFGMAQTAVPFGEVGAVRDWLGIRPVTGKPPQEHPKRPVLGFDCPRSEVSGRRLWSLFQERYGAAETFFKDHFVANYCPLIFMEEGGRNLTPDKLLRSERELLYAACREHLKALLRVLDPEFVVGIGRFAAQRAAEVVSDLGSMRVVEILHPSPASPAANRDWSGQVTRTLTSEGVWYG